MDDSIIHCFFFLGPHHGSGVETWKLPSTMPHMISLHFTLQLSVQRVGVDWDLGTSVDDGAHTLCSSLKRTVRLHFCSGHPALFFSRESLMAEALTAYSAIVLLAYTSAPSRLLASPFLVPLPRRLRPVSSPTRPTPHVRRLLCVSCSDTLFFPHRHYDILHAKAHSRTDACAAGSHASAKDRMDTLSSW